MKFNVKKRDGPAKIGEVNIEKKLIKTPNILFINTKRFKSPDFAEILITNIKNKTKKPTLKFFEKFLAQRTEEKNNKFYYISTNQNSINSNLKNDTEKIIIVANASQLLDQPKNFVDYIVDLRKKIGYKKIIYLSKNKNHYH